MDNISIILAATCATIIVKYGTIFKQLRRVSLFSCPLCLGVWMGWLFSLIYIYINQTIDPKLVWNIIYNGMVTSVFAYIVNLGIMASMDKMGWND